MTESRASRVADPEPLRVLFVIDCLGASGAERSTAALLPVLRDRGHDVEVATLYDSGFGDEDELRASGFVISPLTSVRYLARVRELRRRVRRFQPHVVHTALWSSDMVGRPAGWRCGGSVISSIVNTSYDRHRLADPAVAKWKVRALRVIDAVTAHLFVDRLHAVSAGVAEAAANALWFDRERIEVVERGRSLSALGERSEARRQRTRADLGVDDDSDLVLSVGRQEYQKGHDVLVAAMAVTLRRRPRTRLAIAGRDGNASRVLASALDEHVDVRDATMVLGHRNDVADLLVAADVLVISSYYEGTAGVAIEAMALGCPVVCTEVAGVRGILDDEVNAVMVPIGDPDAIGDAIADLLDDPTRRARLSERGRAVFEQRFTIEASGAAMERMYQRARPDR